MGAGIGNLIRLAGDRHRADKLFEEALKAIRADAQVSAAKPNALPENHSPDGASTETQSDPTTAAPIPAPVAPALSSPAQPSPNAESVSSAEDIATLKGMAATGYPKAQGILAADYLTGHGVPQDYAQAAVWFRKSAERGLAESQSALGFMYEHGYGVPQDYAQAAFWYKKAAEQGDSLAQWCLGSLYDLGRGVPQDYAEAYFWLNLAAAVKIVEVKQEDVAKERDESASHLSPADLSRVQERARKWFEDHPAKP
jgi:TPR repeat protein